MKRVLLSVILVILSLAACKGKESENKKEVEFAVVDVTSLESVNKASEEQSMLNVNASFKYTGDDKYLKVITEEMYNDAKKMFTSGVMLIPSPYIVKMDLSNPNDIKFYGDFWVYGYTINGTIFETKTGTSNRGCYHLKESDGKVIFVSKEIAEEGIFFADDLLNICGRDDKLADAILNIDTAMMDEERLSYIDMYAKENGIRFSGIKDEGWPIVLKRDISDAVFLYNFYVAYFNELRAENKANDLADRILNLKSEYMTDDLIEKLMNSSENNKKDMVYGSEYVTDHLMDTLQVDNIGSGRLKVSYDNLKPERFVINVVLGLRNGDRVLTDIYYD